ncbi:MAG: decarboxylating 6-phosphogluconate dehydrogenase [Pseudomonadota bacterium]
MQIGFVGLGRMGANMVRRLHRGGHQCVVYDANPEQVARMAGENAVPSNSLKELVAKLYKPRVVWMMVPAGAATEQTVSNLTDLLENDDVLVDGGNSFYKDDVRRAGSLEPKGVRYADVGTSGGVWGLERGYCLMIGGDADTVRRLDPIFKTLSPGRGGIAPTQGRRKKADSAEEGYLHCGPVGAGHFVKMIHNGIEYGLMQAYAEGFDILKNADSERLPKELRYEFPLGDIAEVWRRGSIVSSWLLDLAAEALAEDPALSDYEGIVEDSGEGRWTVAAAIEEAVPADVISSSLYARFRSRRQHTFAEKVLSAMRKKFGGHVEPGKK